MMRPSSALRVLLNGREVGVVILPDGENLNHALVKAGLAACIRWRRNLL